jgi:microcystin-dependent protein
MAAYLWPLSRTTVLDLNGEVSPGALLNFWVADTTTPLRVYTDSALSAPHPDVIEADAAGRLPAVYMPYTDYRQRLRTSGGTLLFDDDGISNPEPASSGGGGSVPDDELVKTGDPKWSFGTGALEGFVRLNGSTIGNAGSGALERANADTEALYVWLWDRLNNTIAPVSTGRGGSGAADFAAGKTLTLPSCRGKAPFGLDDMGNSAAGAFSGVTFTQGDATTPGSNGGAGTVTLSIAQMPAHNHPGSSIASGGSHQHPTLVNPNQGTDASSGGGLTGGTQQNGQTDLAGVHTHGLTINSQGGGGAHLNMPPFFLVTWYIKL